MQDQLDLIPNLQHDQTGNLDRIDPKYRSVWADRSPTEQEALSRYFLPHRSSSAVLRPTRPRVLKWYCPFADQATFPSGHRYCINVYAGCAHGCVYCYAAGYEPESARMKREFRVMLGKDLADLDRFDVPPAPLHLSNSTDAFQPLERQTGHTRYALEKILEHRSRFTTITVLTKNPRLAAEAPYGDLLKALNNWPANRPLSHKSWESRRPGLMVEVSLAFWGDAARAVYDPCAPTVQDRIEGIQALHAAGIPLVLRIDPLFPRSPLPGMPVRRLSDFGVPEAQTLDDLANLIGLAKQVKAMCVAYSSAKITRTRQGGLNPLMSKMLEVYRYCSQPGKPVFRSGSWRLPQEVAERFVIGPFRRLACELGVSTEFCMQHLIGTK